MIYLIITAGILVLDLAVKAYIEKTKQPGDTQEILGGKVILQKVDVYKRQVMRSPSAMYPILSIP